MTIEGLGKKFQEARLARNLTLDEAARMTKIRPSRLAEIEADDFSQFPSLAYAKGFLLIYGKFLDVDVTPYMEVFETSEHVTVDGYSYLQDNPAPAPVHTPIARRPRPRPDRSRSASSSSDRASLKPFIIGIIVIGVGFMAMRFIMNVQRIAPRQMIGQASPPAASASPSVATSVVPSPTQATQPIVSASVAPSPTASRPPVALASVAPSASPPAKQVATNVTTTSPAQSVAPASPPPSVAPTAPPVAAASPRASVKPAQAEPEVRKAEPISADDLKKATAAVAAPSPSSLSSTSVTTKTTTTTTTTPEATGPNRVAIRPLKKTYVKVVVDNEAVRPAFERWISPTDGTVEFSGQHISVRVLDRDAVQIKKNGKTLPDNDADVTIE
jgi:cytoskeletal protein RodZ